MKNYVDLQGSIGKKLIGLIWGFEHRMLVFEDSYTILGVRCGYENDYSVRETDMGWYRLINHFNHTDLSNLEVISYEQIAELERAEETRRKRELENYERHQYEELKAKFEGQL